MTTPWRCRLRLHRWQRLHNPQGGWYRECLGVESRTTISVGDLAIPSEED